jgi:hypothetical protein
MPKSSLLTSSASILKTKLSGREGHEAMLVSQYVIQLDQQIKGRQGESQGGLEILLKPMHDLFGMADHRQHEDRRVGQTNL